MRVRSRILPLCLTIAGCIAGCEPGLLTEVERAELADLFADETHLPRSPTNRVADDPAAAEFGRLLFFDERMSSDGTVACASCHDPDEGFSDDRQPSLGVKGRLGDRHSMPVRHAAMQSFLLWDGKADSLWLQPLLAIENPDEMNFSAADVAGFVRDQYAEQYAAVFGAAGDADERVFANVGKALAAYERTLLCVDTRFDRWLLGEVELTVEEELGAAQFVRSGCIRCHNGPAASDGQFHNIGIGSGRADPDLGREAGLVALLAQPFNGVGAHSDDPDFGATKLEVAAAETHTLGAFRTATLRGVGQRSRFGHRGHITDLEAFVELYDERELDVDAVGALDPLVIGIDVEQSDEIVQFLRTLDCPPLPAERLAPDPSVYE